MHWHPDLEFIYIVKGTIDYFVNGKTITINQGDAIFVNSQRLHYGFSKEHNNCTFITLAIFPNLFIHIADSCNEYFQMKFGLKNTDYIPLYHHVEWEKEIIDMICTLYNMMNNSDFKPLPIIYHIGDYKESNHNSIDQDVF